MLSKCPLCDKAPLFRKYKLLNEPVYYKGFSLEGSYKQNKCGKCSYCGVGIVSIGKALQILVSNCLDNLVTNFNFSRLKAGKLILNIPYGIVNAKSSNICVDIYDRELKELNLTPSELNLIKEFKDLISKIEYSYNDYLRKRRIRNRYNYKSTKYFLKNLL